MSNHLYGFCINPKAYDDVGYMWRVDNGHVTQLVEYLNDSQVAAGSSPAMTTEGKRMVSGRFGTAVL
jgi:hypothetical protein